MRGAAILMTAVLLGYAGNPCHADTLLTAHPAPAVAIELHLPLQQLLKQRKSKAPVDGQLSVDGQMIPLTITPRGKSRLARCRFPPLWLDLKKSKTAGSVFEGQNKLKLVTHCGRTLESKGYLAAELLAYRLLNQLSDTSFRARAVTVTYIDTTNNKTQRHHGFVIEHKKQLAKRLDFELLEQPKLKLSTLDGPYITIANLFQFMIANADFSFSQGPDDDDCCHNSVPARDAQGRYFSVPYDFDSSGLVNPPYGVPAQSLGLKRLTQRRYRGFCRHNEFLADARQLFVAKKATLMQMAEGYDEIPNLNHNKVTRFLTDFFDTLETDRRFQRKIVTACRKR